MAQGARVVISGRREDVLKKAVQELGPQADFRVHDVNDFSAAEGLIESVEEQHGALTALINNAGHAVKKPTVELTEEEMLGVFDVHVRGAFSLSKHAAARMMASGGGSILFMASMASLIGIRRLRRRQVRASGYGADDGGRMVAERSPCQRHRPWMGSHRHDQGNSAQGR